MKRHLLLLLLAVGGGLGTALPLGTALLDVEATAINDGPPPQLSAELAKVATIFANVSTAVLSAEQGRVAADGALDGGALRPEVLHQISSGVDELQRIHAKVVDALAKGTVQASVSVQV